MTGVQTCALPICINTNQEPPAEVSRLVEAALLATQRITRPTTPIPDTAIESLRDKADGESSTITTITVAEEEPTKVDPAPMEPAKLTRSADQYTRPRKGVVEQGTALDPVTTKEESRTPAALESVLETAVDQDAGVRDHAPKVQECGLSKGKDMAIEKEPITPPIVARAIKEMPADSLSDETQKVVEKATPSLESRSIQQLTTAVDDILVPVAEKVVPEPEIDAGPNFNGSPVDKIIHIKDEPAFTFKAPILGPAVRDSLTTDVVAALNEQPATTKQSTSERLEAIEEEIVSRVVGLKENQDQAASQVVSLPPTVKTTLPPVLEKVEACSTASALPSTPLPASPAVIKRPPVVQTENQAPTTLREVAFTATTAPEEPLPFPVEQKREILPTPSLQPAVAKNGVEDRSLLPFPVPAKENQDLTVSTDVVLEKKVLPTPAPKIPSTPEAVTTLRQVKGSVIEAWVSEEQIIRSPEAPKPALTPAESLIPRGLVDEKKMEDKVIVFAPIDLVPSVVRTKIVAQEKIPPTLAEPSSFTVKTSEAVTSESIEPALIAANQLIDTSAAMNVEVPGDSEELLNRAIATVPKVVKTEKTILPTKTHGPVGSSVAVSPPAVPVAPKPEVSVHVQTKPAALVVQDTKLPSTMATHAPPKNNVAAPKGKASDQEPTLNAITVTRKTDATRAENKVMVNKISAPEYVPDIKPAKAESTRFPTIVEELPTGETVVESPKTQAPVTLLDIRVPKVIEPAPTPVRDALAKINTSTVQSEKESVLEVQSREKVKLAHAQILSPTKPMKNIPEIRLRASTPVEAQESFVKAAAKVVESKATLPQVVAKLKETAVPLPSVKVQTARLLFEKLTRPKSETPNVPSKIEPIASGKPSTPISKKHDPAPKPSEEKSKLNKDKVIEEIPKTPQAIALHSASTPSPFRRPEVLASIFEKPSQPRDIKPSPHPTRHLAEAFVPEPKHSNNRDDDSLSDLDEMEDDYLNDYDFSNSTRHLPSSPPRFDTDDRPMLPSPRSVKVGSSPITPYHSRYLNASTPGDSSFDFDDFDAPMTTSTPTYSGRRVSVANELPSISEASSPQSIQEEFFKSREGSFTTTGPRRLGEIPVLPDGVVDKRSLDERLEDSVGFTSKGAQKSERSTTLPHDSTPALASEVYHFYHF